MFVFRFYCELSAEFQGKRVFKICQHLAVIFKVQWQFLTGSARDPLNMAASSAIGNKMKLVHYIVMMCFLYSEE